MTDEFNTRTNGGGRRQDEFGFPQTEYVRTGTESAHPGTEISDAKTSDEYLTFHSEETAHAKKKRKRSGVIGRIGSLTMAVVAVLAVTQSPLLGFSSHESSSSSSFSENAWQIVSETMERSYSLIKQDRYYDLAAYLDERKEALVSVGDEVSFDRFVYTGSSVAEIWDFHDDYLMTAEFGIEYSYTPFDDSEERGEPLLQVRFTAADSFRENSHGYVRSVYYSDGQISVLRGSFVGLSSDNAVYESFKLLFSDRSIDPFHHAQGAVKNGYFTGEVKLFQHPFDPVRISGAERTLSDTTAKAAGFIDLNTEGKIDLNSVPYISSDELSREEAFDNPGCKYYLDKTRPLDVRVVIKLEPLSSSDTSKYYVEYSVYSGNVTYELFPLTYMLSDIDISYREDFDHHDW